MFGQTTTTTPPPTDRGLEDLDAAALAYAARIEGLPPERRQEARDDLVRFALPFAGRLARRYRGRGEPLEDLEQVARLGLVNAVDRYDPERGSFTAYAAITIVGEIKRHFRDRTWGVHVPRRLRDLILEVGQATSALTSELSRAPTVAELAERLETPQEEILAALESAAGYSPASLNAPVGGESSAEFGDLVGESDNALESVDDRVTVSGLLHRLPWRERRILAMRFYGNQTQAEIAARFGISQMHVSRLLSRALTWLRQAMLADAPPPWQNGTAESSEPAKTRISVRHNGDRVVVEVGGEVDRDGADQLRRAMLEAVTGQPAEVVVDLVGAGGFDAGGIAALMAGREAAARTGVPLRLTRVQPAVRRSLTAAGLAAAREG
ncbi:SigB/SigF/SigG family RNA polymerase sigma factor [Micromonospora sp. DT46]|uniref:SigB/SigF/SigG family RNA polymerase sigma factor n=1 Tax=unclassified Micromonospora TaxID=2617518 RepID=UPI00124B2A35|nr:MULTISPECIES: SigB/SigF/SigG family RNA polymerase sigma factor [unclassified Micromonospora]KAB1139381.1 SigB/SigF/SigG family RNA polymerase sigma factor [Micromonospora sp. AMSO12t]WSG00111.1 SigB/SigF/SigG family RNA polymerase sigma factor [Micromonospora sp. NBC_01740]